MRIVIAPDKYKGSLSAAAVADAIARGVRQVDPAADIDACPMADGGEGTVSALVAATGGRIVRRTVTGPLPGMRVEAEFGILGDGVTAVIEMAAASGLALLEPHLRSPLRTTTYGTGELLRAAAEAGATHVILGIGGSATIDGGIGCAQACGAQVELENGSAYSAGDRKLTGADLLNVLAVHGVPIVNLAALVAAPAAPKAAGRARSLLPRRSRRTTDAAGRPDASPASLPFGVFPAEMAAASMAHPALPGPRAAAAPGVRITVACDVGNPLYGPDGAALVFGPQKGATEKQVADLDAALERLARRTATDALARAPGAGAAGGLGFGMLAFFNATLRSGIEIVLDATALRDRLAGADLCITGEGRLDAQSLAGKTAVGVARACRDLGVPCIALAGGIGDGADDALAEGLVAHFSICRAPMTLDEAMADAPRLIERAAANVLRVWKAARGR